MAFIGLIDLQRDLEEQQFCWSGELRPTDRCFFCGDPIDADVLVAVLARQDAPAGLHWKPLQLWMHCVCVTDLIFELERIENEIKIEYQRRKKLGGPINM